MNYHEVCEIEPEYFSEDITGLLTYIEKETDFLFDRQTMRAKEVWVSSESEPFNSGSGWMPNEFYGVYLNNYNIYFRIRQCACPGCGKILDIELTPSYGLKLGHEEPVTEIMRQILPDIPIYAFDQNDNEICCE